MTVDFTAEGWSLDIPEIPAPAGTKLADIFAWAGTGLPLRIERVHTHGRTGDGLVLLTAHTLKKLGLPATLPDGAKATTLKKKLTTAATVVGLETSEEIGPAFHVFRRAGSAGGPKTSLRVIVVPWLGQGTERQQATTALLTQLATTTTGTPDANTLARRLRAWITDLGVAPATTPAATSRALLEAVRPRHERLHTEGGWETRLRDGALPEGDTAVPPAAGARHPATRERLQDRLSVCEEEDFKWWARPFTAEEARRPWVVAVDVCASYLSVTQTLPLPAGPLTHTTAPRFDQKTAGLWWCDFTGIQVHPLLPHPATFHGNTPDQPGWYATPTVQYMATTYGFDPATITEAYVWTHTVPFLKEWTVRIREAYKRVYAALGLEAGQTPDDFLTAYAGHKDTADDPAREDALVLASLYKQIYKGGIGKWADSSIHLDEGTWLNTVVTNWSYRPEVRHTIIAAARIAGHRRMTKTLTKTGRAPFAVNVDSYLYAVDAPSPHELLTPPENGKPVLGVVQLGIDPGKFKHEATIPTRAVRDLLEQDQPQHPSRLTHRYDTQGNPLTEEVHG